VRLGVFICYRREDSSGFARLIYDRLTERLGREGVFFDVDNIAAGVDFVDTLSECLGKCDALLAVIGKSWVSSSYPAGRRRLDDPDDFVRLEIEAALQRQIRVIPVLVDGAAMPGAEDLPDSMKQLIRRQGVEISHTRFNSDVERLTQALSSLPEEVRLHEAEQAKRKDTADPRARPADLVSSEAPSVRRVSRNSLVVTGLAGASFLAAAALLFEFSNLNFVQLRSAPTSLPNQSAPAERAANSGTVTAAPPAVLDSNTSAQEPEDACVTQATDKKIVGAAKTSFMTKCERTSCEGQAKDKNLHGAAMSSFVNKCVMDALNIKM